MTETGSLGIRQPVPGQQHAPARQVVQRRRPDRHLEFQREGRSRHAGALRQLLQCPAMRRIVVHGVDRGAHLLVGEGEQPPDAASRALPPDAAAAPEPASCRRDAARPGSRPGCRSRSSCRMRSMRPAQRRLVRVFPDMRDRRQHRQQDAGMIAGQGEVPADDRRNRRRRCSTAMPPLRGGGKDRACVDGRQGQIAGKAERPPARQQEAVPGVQAHRVGNALHGQPALAAKPRRST